MSGQILLLKISLLNKTPYRVVKTAISLWPFRWQFSLTRTSCSYWEIVLQNHTQVRPSKKKTLKESKNSFASFLLLFMKFFVVFVFVHFLWFTLFLLPAPRSVEIIFLGKATSFPSPWDILGFLAQVPWPSLLCSLQPKSTVGHKLVGNSKGQHCLAPETSTCQLNLPVFQAIMPPGKLDNS